MTTDDNPTHLDPHSVEEYFRVGAKTAFDLIASPVVRMEIDPAQETIELTTPAAGANPEVTSFERLSFAQFMKDEVPWFRLRVDAQDMHYEAYVLIESTVALLRSGASFRHAVSEALVSFQELLASRRRLTAEKVLGLIGELLVLRHVIGSAGEKTAIESWLGPSAEEHDFGFSDFDAEVKTTKSETRVHVIGSETQLEPSPGAPLHLVSIQITRAGAAAQGFTLASLIAEIRESLTHSLRTFDAALEGLGWREADKDLYKVKYQLRSVPRAYLIDEHFPAITSARLDAVIPNRINVSNVSYRVNVTDLPHAAIGAPLNDFCEDSE